MQQRHYVMQACKKEKEKEKGRKKKKKEKRKGKNELDDFNILPFHYPRGQCLVRYHDSCQGVAVGCWNPF
jgi:hypothetical protein